MSYKKNTWKTGDVITAESMNNIEEGIESKMDLPNGMAVGKILTVGSNNNPSWGDISSAGG